MPDRLLDDEAPDAARRADDQHDGGWSGHDEGPLVWRWRVKPSTPDVLTESDGRSGYCQCLPEIAGFYSDSAGKSHGFIYADGAFSTVDVAGARATLLTRIKNGGAVTGVCYDALNEGHGITGQ